MLLFEKPPFFSTIAERLPIFEVIPLPYILANYVSSSRVPIGTTKVPTNMSLMPMASTISVKPSVTTYLRLEEVTAIHITSISFTTF